MSPHVTEAVLDAIAANREQQRVIYDPTPEVDSLVEYARELARTATPEQRPLVAALIGGLRKLGMSNNTELDRERTVAEAVDHNGWNVKRAAAELRGPLDVIVYPAKYHPSEQRAALEQVRDVIRRCPADVLAQPSLRGELRDRKLRALRALMGPVA